MESVSLGTFFLTNISSGRGTTCEVFPQFGRAAQIVVRHGQDHHESTFERDRNRHKGKAVRFHRLVILLDHRWEKHEDEQGIL